MDFSDTTTDAPEPVGDDLPEHIGADQFLRDTRTEKVLVDNHLDFEFEVIDLTAIDLSVLDDGHPERQMRDEIIHADVAHRYADDLKHGAQFPAGVLSRHSSNFRIVDFHHRLSASRTAGLTQVSAYVVPDMEDFGLVELGNLLNRNHGVPLSEGERIRQALWGLDLGKFTSVKQAARTLGIPESKVAKERRIRQAKSMAAEAGVSAIAFGLVPRATQERLSSLDSPEVFKQAANAVINKSLDTIEAGKLVTAINSAAGDSAKIEVIKAFAAGAEPKKVATVSHLSDPWFRVHTGLRAVLAVELGVEFDLSLGRRGTHDLDQLRSEITAVTEKLAVIDAKIEAMGTTDDAQADAG